MALMLEISVAGGNSMDSSELADSDDQPIGGSLLSALLFCRFCTSDPFVLRTGSSMYCSLISVALSQRQMYLPLRNNMSPFLELYTQVIKG